MKTGTVVAVPPDQIQQWRTDGFLVLPQALPPERIARVQAAVDRLYERYLAGELENLSRDRETATIFPPHWRWIDPGWDRRALAFRRWNIVEDDPIFLDLIDDDAFFPAVLQIMGPLVQVGMTHAIVLPPEMADPPYLHVDGGASLGRIRPDAQSPPLSVRVQLFLTDLDAEDLGNFMVVPGSHTRPLPDDPLRNPPAGAPPLRQLKVRAGDAVLFTHSLWHGAAANHGPRDRKTLIYGYVQRFLKPYDYEQISPETLSRCTPRQRLLLGDLGGWHWRAGCHYYENDNFVDIMARGA